MFTTRAFELLAELEANNNRDWFMAHRDAIRGEVQEPFARMLDSITHALASSDVPLQGGAHTMFRMHRDVRFSADKSPYKPSVSGILTPNGSKDEGGGLLYLQMDKDGGFVACGFYRPATASLNRLRDRIVDEPDTFRAVLDELGAASLALSSDDMLKAMPRGYTGEADAWYAEHLKRKSLTVQRAIAKGAWLSGEVVAQAAAIGRACAGLLAFGKAA